MAVRDTNLSGGRVWVNCSGKAKFCDRRHVHKGELFITQDDVILFGGNKYFNQL